MKQLLRFAFSFASRLRLPRARRSEGEAKPGPTTPQTRGPVPLDVFKFESAYVFGSDLNHGGSFGKQDEIQNNFEYGHRIQLTGNYYLRLGIAYERYDFGSTSAPVPNHLQAIAGVIGVEYMHGSDVGAFFAIPSRILFRKPDWDLVL